MYYLQSRYYDPEVCRFINADEFASTGQGFLGYNMFAYCNNNPINCYDCAGALPCHNTMRMVSDSGKKPTNISVNYDVPLYQQKRLNLCGVFSQLMVEDYERDVVRDNDDVITEAAIIAYSVHGAQWNQGTWPQNVTNPQKHDGESPPSLIALYCDLLNYGPIYAYYFGSNSHHLVVVTGVDYLNGLVFINNPQGYSGAQTYDEFLSGFLGQSPSNDSTFDYLIYPD